MGVPEEDMVGKEYGADVTGTWEFLRKSGWKTSWHGL